MPTSLGDPYSLSWRGNPPHMLQEDVPMWHTFLDKYSFLFERIYYDILLGGPSLSEMEMKDPIKRQWQYNTSKRADAIAVLSKEI